MADATDVQEVVHSLPRARCVTRVLVDTSAIIFALLFPTSVPAQALAIVLDEHALVLTQWVLDELNRIVGDTRPDLPPALGVFLLGIEYE